MDSTEFSEKVMNFATLGGHSKIQAAKAEHQIAIDEYTRNQAVFSGLESAVNDKLNELGLLVTQSFKSVKRARQLIGQARLSPFSESANQVLPEGGGRPYADYQGRQPRRGLFDVHERSWRCGNRSSISCRRMVTCRSDRNSIDWNRDNDIVRCSSHKRDFGLVRRWRTGGRRGRNGGRSDGNRGHCIGAGYRIGCPDIAVHPQENSALDRECTLRKWQSASGNRCRSTWTCRYRNPACTDRTSRRNARPRIAALKSDPLPDLVLVVLQALDEAADRTTILCR